MNIFAQLLKPFIKTIKQHQDSIDFDGEPSETTPAITPVIFISPSPPKKIPIMSKTQHAKTIIPKKLRRNNSLPNTSNPNSQSEPEPEPEPIVYKYTPPECSIGGGKTIVYNTKEGNFASFNVSEPQATIDDYEFHCTNISSNLHPYIKKTNTKISPDPSNSNKTDVIQQQNWQAPKNHGLENSKRIIPDYYFQSYQSIQNSSSNNRRNAILEIDYLYIIKDDIRNMRKLNQYQIDYIKKLDEATKNEIISEFHKATNVMIDMLSVINSDSNKSSQKSSSNDLLSCIEEAIESNRPHHPPEEHI